MLLQFNGRLSDQHNFKLVIIDNNILNVGTYLKLKKKTLIIHTFLSMKLYFPL